MNNRDFTAVINRIKTVIGTRNFVTPFQAAGIIQDALVAVESFFMRLDDLEWLIRAFYRFPPVVQLGNLNWTQKTTEDVAFSQLMLMFDYGTEALVLGVRINGRIHYDNPETTALTHKFTRLFFKNVY